MVSRGGYLSNAYTYKYFFISIHYIEVDRTCLKETQSYSDRLITYIIIQCWRKLINDLKNHNTPHQN